MDAFRYAPSAPENPAAKTVGYQGRSHLQGKITGEQLLESTVQLGFSNVIDAFHVVNRAEVPIRFFTDERRSRKGIHLTQELLALPEVSSVQYGNLPHEIEARWRLVESAWELQLPAALLSVSTDMTTRELFILDRAKRRRNLSPVRDALNGYQKGHCFYCGRQISLNAGDEETQADVDHFFPHALMSRGLPLNLDGVWNLVLACRSCNRGEDGKFACLPAQHFLERLYRRNSYFIHSHHPLRETLINQLGSTDELRSAFLQQVDREALAILTHRWKPHHAQPTPF